MTKKRTKKQKKHAESMRVNTQLDYKFNKSYNLSTTKEIAVNTEKNNSSGTIKKELFKSFGVAILILISLMVLYWLS